MTVSTVCKLPLSTRAYHIHIIDALLKENGTFTLVIRDQKTTASSGFYKCVLPHILDTLMEHWVDKARMKLLSAVNVLHENVFFALNTGKPFNEKTFSKYTAAAFLSVTGEKVGLQVIRRMVINGLVIFYNMLFLLTFPQNTWLGTNHRQTGSRYPRQC